MGQTNLNYGDLGGVDGNVGVVIYEALEAVGDYSMSLTSEEGAVVERVVNIGIDAHLEAVDHRLAWIGGRLRGSVTSAGMAVLLRRLTEDGADDAMDFASSILYTLGIEWI